LIDCHTHLVFGGDRSGEFLYRHLYRAGFANQPTATHREDGLKLRNAYITAAARCAPPDNKPLPEELARCRPYLEAELDLLRPKAVLALGRIAFDAFLNVLVESGAIPRRSAFAFAHGAGYDLPGDFPRLFASYHPSQQNTQTGRLPPGMFLRVLREIRRFLDK
ncbi:MAG: uracil-DNA glycosylase family protein, partial [Planctomycetota bacterium]